MLVLLALLFVYGPATLVTAYTGTQHPPTVPTCNATGDMRPGDVCIVTGDGGMRTYDYQQALQDNINAYEANIRSTKIAAWVLTGLDVAAVAFVVLARRRGR
jgi:hypothetical protein